MARHTLWAADEVIERITDDFAKGMADLDRLEAETRAALATLDRLVGGTV